MGSENTINEDEFNTIQFEKRLTSLKDSQEHINACCKWCLDNRKHHKHIVSSWLNVLKRVKVEQRLNLFYLANDVIQYSKRRHYDFVDSWGTALQKATTLVRDAKVKHKIIRIFGIWEQRGIYNEDFISDLCGLISVVPMGSKNDEPHEFQANYVIAKIKQCSKLESETDGKLKALKEHNPKIPFDLEQLCSSLKQRAHVDDVERELAMYAKQLESYVNALKAEIKCRIENVSVLKHASTQLEKDKRDVKVVANAYRSFGQRIRTFQRKLEEHDKTLSSPIPSPDVDAPSPGPECDIELPGDENTAPVQKFHSPAGYYDPQILTDYSPTIATAPTTTSNSHIIPLDNNNGGTPPDFTTNGFSSFIGTNFNFTNLNTSALFRTDGNEMPPAPTALDCGGGGGGGLHLPPLPPPPMPPFATKDDFDATYGGGNNASFSLPGNFDMSVSVHNQSNATSSMHSTSNSSSYTNVPPPPFHGDEYNPEQEPWENDHNSHLNLNWSTTSLHNETPDSPPHFEKEGDYSQLIEYNETMCDTSVGSLDVDHRILTHPTPQQIDNDRFRGATDVDHRNLISLTASPNADSTSESNSWRPTLADQDYRKPMETPQQPAVNNSDQDYRQPLFNIEQLKLPPPPPPPPPSSSSGESPADQANRLIQQHQTAGFQKNLYKQQLSLLPPPPPLLRSDQLDAIDMDLSEEDLIEYGGGATKALVNTNEMVRMPSLKPPPPLPNLPDDVDVDNNDEEDCENFQYSSHPDGMMYAHQNFNGDNGQFMGPPPPPPLPPPPPPSSTAAFVACWPPNSLALQAPPPPLVSPSLAQQYMRGRRGGGQFMVRGRGGGSPTFRGGGSSSFGRGRGGFNGGRGGSGRNRRQRGNFRGGMMPDTV